MTETQDITARAIGYQENLDSQILDYLGRRGISDHSIDKYSIGYCSNNLSMMHNRVTFPLRGTSGETIAIQGRYLGSTEGVPKYWNTPYSKGSHLYGFYECFNLIKEYKFCVIVEGPIDAVTFNQMGIPAVALWGLQCTPTQAFMLASCCDFVVSCLDGDKAGFVASENIDKRMSKYNISVYKYQTEAKDINEDWVNDPKRASKRIRDFIFSLYE